MKQLIDKAAVVAEIERRRKDWRYGSSIEAKYKSEECDDILSFLDTLGTKEADLEEAINGLTCGWIEGEEYGELQNINTARCVTLGEVKEVMRCIYELGLMHRKENNMTGKDIEKASVDYQMSTRPMAIGGDAFDDIVYRMNINPSFIAGAEWVLNNLWKPADGNDLPEIDREVVVLYQHYPLDVNEYSVGFAHRPPEYWDGKNIGTGVVTRYYPKKYGKGGWSSPDVKWWLDLDLPKPKVEE